MFTQKRTQVGAAIERRSKRSPWLAACGALLLVAGGLSVAVHLANGRHTASHVVSQATQQASTAASASPAAVVDVVPPIVSLAELPTMLTVYLVNSQAAADTLVHDLTQFTRKLDGTDWAKIDEQVLVVGSAGERSAARATLKDLQLQYGAENVHIHDLRRQ